MLPIPGTSSITHLEENVEGASMQSTDEEYMELNGVARLPASDCYRINNSRPSQS
jgi:aryl-alcohol dehydrogenase-like predicted oxidoreductase